MEKIYFLYLLFVFLLSTSVPVFSQAFGGGNQQPSVTGRITGDIIDSLTNAPVEFATVALRFQDSSKDIDGIISNDKGHFRLSGVKLGSYDLYISFIGYQTKKIDGIKLTPEKPDYDIGTVNLVTDAVLLGEVEVTAEAALIENKVDRIVYNAEKDASSVGGDAADVLRKVPMLSVDLEGNVSLRGSQNVKILLNGKPSGMFSSNVADALKMFPADQIKSVEVITTPGAKYDAEGTGGIINIITKKKRVDGYSGSVNGSVGTRQNRGSLNLNAAQGRFGINGAGNVFYSWPADANTYFYREDNVAGQARTLEQSGLTENARLGFFAKAGAFYDFNAYNTLNTSINFRGFSFDREGFNDAKFNDPIFGLNQEYRRDEVNDMLRSGFDWTTDYIKTYKNEGQELSFGFQLNNQVSDDHADFVQTSSDELLRLTERNKNDGKNRELTFQTDYVHPFSKNLKLETGAKAVIRKIDSDYQYETMDLETGLFNFDYNRSNEFNYEQDVYAGYASLNINFAKTYSLAAGARYEHTTIKGDFLSGEEIVTNDYDNFVPSIILSKKIGFNTLKASYARRIKRPSLQFINPFVNSVDRRNIYFGNPELGPELSDQYDIGYTSFKRGTVVAASIYYRRTKDVIQAILNVSEEGVSQTTFNNIGIDNAYGMNVFTSFNIKQFWTLRGNLDIYGFEAESTDPTLDLKNSGLQYKIFAMSSFKFKHGISMDVFGIFNSPRKWLQGTYPSFSMFSMGIKKELWEKRGSLGLTFIDPWQETKSFNSELEGPNFYQKTEFDIPFRSIGINFSYRFGKLDFKARQPRSKIRNTDLKQGEDNQGGGTGGGGQTGG